MPEARELLPVPVCPTIMMLTCLRTHLISASARSCPGDTPRSSSLPNDSSVVSKGRRAFLSMFSHVLSLAYSIWALAASISLAVKPSLQ